MKTSILSLILLGLLSVPSMALSGENSHPTGVNPSLLEETQGWSMEDHLTAAKTHEQKAQNVETRIQNLEERIARLNDKPYFDPKGFGRSSSKNILAALQGELTDLQSRIAWHYQQTNQAKNF